MSLSIAAATPVSAALAPQKLRCETRSNPLGVDASAPRLSWILGSDQSVRGLRQSAYHVLVASSPAILSKNRGDLWDSKRVASAQSLNVIYSGKPLQSAQRVWWKIRFWDAQNRLSSWSQNSEWTMGLLQSEDWKAQWIAAPGASDAAPKTLGFHGAETQNQNENQWVQVDLGRALPLETVRLHPMLHADKSGFGFPLRFVIEASNEADFGISTLIADQSAADFPNPGAAPVSFDAKNQTARFVRVTASKLWKRDATHFAFALRQLEVVSGGKNVALNAPVTAKNSVEYAGWGLIGLTDGVLSAGEARPASVMLRREFSVKPGLRRAIAFVSGLGHYEMTLNGRKVGDDILAPGWTNYRKTVLYDTRDISAGLQTGENAVGLLLGNGMYHVEAGRYSKFTGSFGAQKAIAQLRLEYADGSVQIIGTDENWRAARGPITFSSVYGGEDFDARLEPRGWNRPGFDAANWKPAQLIGAPGGVLRGISVANPPIRAFETFTPVATRELRPGVTVYDLGQNASVLPRLTVEGAAGASVRLIPGELLKPDGSVSQQSSGGPAYWQYTLSGSGSETYFSKFFSRGLRYLQVETSPAPGQTEAPQVKSLATVVVHADSPQVGTFTSSNELFNRIWTLVRWAQRSNMASLMTDCPHREKLGWLEETYLNGPALRYNFDMERMFAKTLNDIADSQTPSGLVPSIAPEFVKFGGDGDSNPFRNSPEWGSAVVLVPWQQYEFNGDTQILRRHYDGMKRYFAFLESKSRDHILDFGLGDWYDIGPKPPGASQLTPRALTATAIYYEDAQVMARTARLLGQSADATRFETLCTAIRGAFNRKFFNAESGTYATNSQTANSMPLVLGLVEDTHRASVLNAIVADVRARGNALTAGDVGYRYLLRALADNGRSDVIFAMNNQSEKPGYGYQLKMGATSLTEAWDANPSSSQNHFMLGQINEWFFHDLAGIQPSGPGFSQITIKPAMVGDLSRVAATFESVYGPIRSEWTRQNGKIMLKVSIPANTSALVHMLTSDAKVVKESGKLANKARGVKWVRMEKGAAVFAVEAGDYVFESATT